LPGESSIDTAKQKRRYLRGEERKLTEPEGAKNISTGYNKKFTGKGKSGEGMTGGAPERSH